MLVVTLVQIKHQIFIFVICDQINNLNYRDLFDFDYVKVCEKYFNCTLATVLKMKVLKLFVKILLNLVFSFI